MNEFSCLSNSLMEFFSNTRVNLCMKFMPACMYPLFTCAQKCVCCGSLAKEFKVLYVTSHRSITYYIGYAT